ncbi:MAG: hypothetical protein HKM97_02360 [Acidimicrobiia bacterium]|nr:hypothetical protein [Acidimicrobiia bacterium]
MADSLPRLPDDFEPTRATLHAYAHAVGAIPRAHAEPHDLWWHVSLKVTDRGLETDRMSLPDGGTFNLRMDLETHEVVVDAEQETRIAMTDGITGTDMGDRLIAAVAALGLDGEYTREKFENEEARPYDPAAAATYFAAATTVDRVFKQHLGSLDGEVSQVQLWPHNFDLACEWFGTRVETHEEEGVVTEYPSQLNLGFYPEGRAYFYSNPWPFEADKLLKKPLPHGAEWHTEGWEGSILYYDQLAGDPDGLTKLADYARAVFKVASPTLA